MKVFHLITSLQGGGTETFLDQILSSSPEHVTHRIFYLKNDGVIGDKIRSRGYRVEKVQTLRSFWNCLRSEKPDVLHTCLYRAHQIGRVLGHFANVPFIVSTHQAIDRWQKPWQKALEALTLRYAQLVLVNSEAAKKIILERCARARVVKLPNGVDPAYFQPRDPTASRTLFQLPPDVLIGGSLCRLHPEKGADRIPRVAAELLTRFPKMHLAVAGDGPLKTTLMHQTSGHSWSDRLHWIGWTKNTAEFLSSINFFWLLSREESFPQALLESSVIGTPWCAPEVGGVGELAIDVPGSRLFAPDDDTLAVQGIQTFLADLESRTRQTRSVKDFLGEKYSLRKMTSDFYRLLDVHRSGKSLYSISH